MYNESINLEHGKDNTTVYQKKDFCFHLILEINLILSFLFH